MTSHDTNKLLAGKVALVTGAGRGLGRAFAEKLAALGADVAIHGMRENGPAEYGEGTTLTAVAVEIGREFGVRSQRVLGDLTKGEDIARVIAETEAALGPIDILVHNAGGDIAAGGGKPDPNDAVNIKEADVRAVLERNLLSTILTCQAVARGMMERRRGRIVTLGSVAAFKGRTQGLDLCGLEGRRGPLHAMPGRPTPPLRRRRQLHRARRYPHRPLPRNACSRPRQNGRDRHARPDRNRRRGRARCRILRRAHGRLRFRSGAADRRRRAVLAGLKRTREAKQKRAAASGPFA
ncbi:NAD(P)-dependent dehydrogenase (short-subunit alcohol dehydrogenase family) [Bradyrhizobium sp. GM2.4]